MKNPIFGKIHETQSAVIAVRFPALQSTKDRSALPLWKYIAQRPQKFFSEFARQAYSTELERLDKENSTALRQLISDELDSINNAFRHIEEINGFNWHDDPLEGDDDYRKLMLIDQNLNPAYLRLTEAVLKPLLMLPAYFSRVARGKGTAKLELYDISIELDGTELSKILQSYEPLMRNGIAHGGVTYGANRVFYKDKKGNSKELLDREVINLFDELLDVCNGLIAAISEFFLGRAGGEYPKPQHLALEELRTETQTPYWKIVGWLPAEQINGSQLIVYVEVTTLDYQKALFSSFQTAVLTEQLCPGADRYFLSLSQPNGWRGFGAFKGKALAFHREKQHGIDQYNDVLEDTGIFYVPRVRLPRLAGKFGSFWLAYKVGKLALTTEFRKNFGLCNVIVRRTELHRNSWGAVLKAHVVVEADGEQIGQSHLRRQCRSIIRKSLKEARRKQPGLSILRYLPLGFARVHVFRRDYRNRRLVNFGLEADMVASLEIKRIRRIKAPDIAGSTIEMKRGVRIAWNRLWMQSRTIEDDA